MATAGEAVQVLSDSGVPTVLSNLLLFLLGSSVTGLECTKTLLGCNHSLDFFTLVLIYGIYHV